MITPSFRWTGTFGGGVTSLRRQDAVSDHILTSKDVLIRVQACGLCHADMLMLEGKYQSNPQTERYIPGSEIAGFIVQSSAESPFAEGDRVVAASWLGGAATYAVVPEQRIARLPDNIPFDIAASMVFNYSTAQSVIRQAGIHSGQSILVTGAGGGLGTALINTLNWLGCDVVAHVHRDAAIPMVRSFEPRLILRSDEDLSTSKRTFDVVIDSVGGLLPRSLDLLRRGGSYVVLGYAGSRSVDRLRTSELIYRNITMVGVAWDIETDTDPLSFPDSFEIFTRMHRDGLKEPACVRFDISNCGLSKAITAIRDGSLVGKAVLVGFPRP